MCSLVGLKGVVDRVLILSVHAGWAGNDGFCEAPSNFETECATSYNFAEAWLAHDAFER